MSDAVAADAMDARLFVLGREAIPGSVADAVVHSAVVTKADCAIITVTGPGVVDCLQGMLTNDIVGPGPTACVYAAALTPKGMIVADIWVVRQEGDVQLITSDGGRQPLLEILTRSLPPRLARAQDQTHVHAILRLAGPASLACAVEAGYRVPEPGQATTGELDGTPYVAARPSLDQPFTLQVLSDMDHAETLMRAFERAGVLRTSPAALELARVLAGWPRRGAEIGPKTLPQEVRLDEIGGVSYTKGCYTGQETVARVHFRGHPNRWLSGLHWDSEPDPGNELILSEERNLGRVSSIVWAPHLSRFIGMGVIRREVHPGALVVASGAPARVLPLPFDFD